MTAQQAREMTAANLKGPVIEPFLEAAYGRIKEAAECGKSSVAHPFCDVKSLVPSSVRDAALSHLEHVDGFKVVLHKVPPSNDPRERDWDEVSW